MNGISWRTMTGSSVSARISITADDFSKSTFSAQTWNFSAVFCFRAVDGFLCRDFHRVPPYAQGAVSPSADSLRVLVTFVVDGS